MTRFKIYLFPVFTLCCLFTTYNGLAQILDDTTRQLYGTHTTYYQKESDILNNARYKRTLDTLLTDLHNKSFIFDKNVFYQDLGLMGTPVQRYGYQMPDRPGRRYGYENFLIYEFSPSTIDYFDTRSPFSEISYIQGSRGQQLAQARFSRNINPNWNFGFDYRIFKTDKINGLFRKDRNNIASAFDFYTHYFTPNKRYGVLANFSFYDQQFMDTGGINPDSTDTYFDLFDDIRESVYIPSNDRERKAMTNNRKGQYHIYQQFDLFGDSLAQLYNIFDYSSRTNWIKIRNHDNLEDYLNAYGLPLEPARYPYSTFNMSGQKLLENESGLKGLYNDLNYRIFYRYKEINYRQYYDSASIRYVEQFAGGALSYTFPDSLFNIDFSGEKMIGGKDYSIKTSISNAYLKAGYNRMAYSPSLFQTMFIGNFLQWLPDENLKETTSNHLYLMGSLTRKRFFVRAGFNYYTIRNYIYLDADKYRKQASDDQLVKPLDVFLNAGVNVSRFHLENYLEYRKVDGTNGGEDLIRVPEYSNKTRLYYQNNLLKRVAFFQLGVDLNYRSGYYADYYLPNYQHYYLNNNFFIQPYMYADIFLNVQLKTVLGFVKVSNVTQNLRDNTSILGPGYFVTPWYAGLPRTFIFGLAWRFYN